MNRFKRYNLTTGQVTEFGFRQYCDNPECSLSQFLEQKIIPAMRICGEPQMMFPTFPGCGLKISGIIKDTSLTVGIWVDDILLGSWAATLLNDDVSRKVWLGQNEIASTVRSTFLRKIDEIGYRTVVEPLPESEPEAPWSTMLLTPAIGAVPSQIGVACEIEMHVIQAFMTGAVR